MAITGSDRAIDFVAQWTAHARRVYSFILSIHPHWADAEEAFQETSLVLWEKFEEFEPGTDFTAWACRVAYYKVLAVRRRKQRGPMAFSEAFMEAIEQEIAVQTPNVSSRHEALHHCLTQLSDRDRDLVRRRYSDGATVKSVADDVGRSADGIYKSLNRIHQALLACIRHTLAAEGSAAHGT
jgi:RNA polymerase sigma-70 factor (ECF subfamily)